MALIFSNKLAFALIAIIMGFGVLGGLILTAQPVAANSPPSTKTVVNGIELTMTIPKATFQVGEPVNITFIVTNISSQNITLAHSAEEFGFTVYDEFNGSIYVYGAFEAIPFIVWLYTLQPGESYTRTLIWPQTCNQTIVHPEGATPVSPGLYSIIGVISESLQLGPLQIRIGGVNMDSGNPVSVSLAVGVVSIGIMVPALTLLAAALTKRKHS